MAHVTINEITPRTTFVVTTASSGPFTIPSGWGFFALTDFKVYNATLGTELTYDASPADNTEFSVSGNAVDGGYQGGTFSLGGTVTNTTLILERAVPYARTDDFPYPSPTLNILSLNTALDKFAAWAQQIVAKFLRVLTQPSTDTANIGALPTATERASKYLAFDADGDPMASDGPSDIAISSAMTPVVQAESLSAGRTAFGLAIGVDVQAYDPDTLKADTPDVLTAGFAATPYDAGTKTTGTFTPDEANGNLQQAVNGGAHTLAPPTNNTSMVIQYTNNGSAGSLTTSGFTMVTGDTVTTTNGHDFLFFITKINGFSHLHVTALQ